MAKRKVIFAKLHQAPYTPGTGQMKDTFPNPDKTLEDLAMYAEDNGNLDVTFKYKGQKRHFIFTAANVQVMELEQTKAEGPKIVL